MKDIINSTLIDKSDQFNIDFTQASPFKHLSIENFLSKEFLKGILDEFPVPRDPNNLKNEFGQKSRKHAVHNIRSLGPTFERWDSFLQSKQFISWLSEITGIQDLLFDPEYHGA